jgi:hypothetical protein
MQCRLNVIFLQLISDLCKTKQKDALYGGHILSLVAYFMMLPVSKLKTKAKLHGLSP